jgi:hypothetical protein
LARRAHAIASQCLRHWPRTAAAIMSRLVAQKAQK